MKDDIYTAREKTRAAVAQITSWCLVIALHQTQGIGPRRQERCAEAADKLQQRYARIIRDKGRRKAMEQLQRELAASLTNRETPCPLQMRVPLNRAPRSRREEQIAQAGNEAATFAWLIFATAVRQALGFGCGRLDALYHETLENYRQFNTWAAMDEREAWEKLRYCAQQAVGAAIEIVDEEEKGADPLQVAVDLQAARRDTMREAIRQTANDRARAGATAPPLAVLSPAARRDVMEAAGILPMKEVPK